MTTSLKQSYTIPCSSAFRDAVLAHAAHRRVNVGDLARSVMLVVPLETIRAAADPGEPVADDRETVILKSGPAAGRPWRRKPRLQLRMSPGHRIDTIRRALKLAVDMADGTLAVSVDRADVLRARDAAAARTERARQEETVRIADAMKIAAEAPAALARTREELQRLHGIIAALSFEPLDHGVLTRNDALHVLGFPPGSSPDRSTLRRKYRLLASVHHPDSTTGNHLRMTQLNAAMELLRRPAA